jgi:HK97 family phage prohead protease
MPNDDEQKFETRHVWEMEDIEVRETSGGMRFSGYAAVFNTDSVPLPFIERIMPGAFKRTLARGREVRMFLNHNQDFVLGTTKRNVNLAEDDHGLRVEADLVDTTYARDLAVNMREGIVTKMSFGFTVSRSKGKSGDETDDQGRRLLRELNLFDVSPVTGFPAYEATSAVVRSLAENIGATADALELAMRALAESTDLLTAEQFDLLSSVIHARRAKPARDWAAELASLRR